MIESLFHFLVVLWLFVQLVPAIMFAVFIVCAIILFCIGENPYEPEP